MDRTSTLVAPSARHPFRRTIVLNRIERARLRDESDVKLFALSFVAFFVCFYTFIL